LLLAEKRIGEFIARVGNGKSDAFKTLLVVSGEQMSGMTAANPLNGNPMRLIEVRTLKPTHGTGLHSVTPAHCIEDLKLSYMFNLKRDGILCSKTGAINTGPLSGIQNQDTAALQSYFGSHPSFFANWKH
jgi:isoleucyl-tRNA synthetase